MKNMIWLILVLTMSFVKTESCYDIAHRLHNDEQILNELTSINEKDSSILKNDLDCISTLVRGNFFDSAKLLLNLLFEKESKDKK